MNGNFTGLNPKESVPTLTSWRSGMESGVSAERNVSDWATFLSPGVPQYQPGSRDYANKIFDTVSCVAFASALGSVQAQANYLLPTLTEGQRYLLERRGFIVEGKVKLSARFTAYASGTTHNGNSYERVLDSIRNVGCVPERDWPFSADLRSFEEWIARPANYAELEREAAAWRSVFQLKYEWLFWNGDGLNAPQKLARIRAALPNAPVLVGRPWCRSCDPSQVKEGVPIKDCGKVEAGHATCIVSLQKDNDQEVRDTYPIYDRVFDDAYHIHHAFSAVLTVNAEAPQKPKPVTPSRHCHFNDRNEAVAELQAALVHLGYLKAPSPVGRPWYGNLTAAAVLAFQIDSGISPVSAHDFGPKSLAAMRLAMA